MKEKASPSILHRLKCIRSTTETLFTLQPLDSAVSLQKLSSSSEFVFHTPPAHRGSSAVVALISALHADLGVAVGRVEPACLLSLLPLLQELEGQPSGIAILFECKRRDGGRDLHLALVSGLLPDDGVSVGVAGPVTLKNTLDSLPRSD